METPEIKPWYKKKRYIIPLGVVGLLVIVGLSNNSPAQPTIQPQIQGAIINQTSTGNLNPTPQVNQIQTQPTPVPVASPQPDLSNNNYYTNVNGNSVHSPAYSNGGVPADASALCVDGTYSFSKHKQGTCSHHGGVAQDWGFQDQ